jgi:hypothetical protein
MEAPLTGRSKNSRGRSYCGGAAVLTFINFQVARFTAKDGWPCFTESAGSTYPARLQIICQAGHAGHRRDAGAGRMSLSSAVRRAPGSSCTRSAGHGGIELW